MIAAKARICSVSESPRHTGTHRTLPDALDIRMPALFLTLGDQEHPSPLSVRQLQDIVRDLGLKAGLEAMSPTVLHNVYTQQLVAEDPTWRRLPTPWAKSNLMSRRSTHSARTRRSYTPGGKITKIPN